MTFDIKKLSSALVIAALFSASVSAETPELSEHDQAVLRATNVFYNLFATNALQAARAVISGNLTTKNLFVEGNAVIDGSLVVTGTISSVAGITLTGGETVVGPFTQTAGNVSISQDAAGVAPRSVAIGNVTNTTGVTLTGGTGGLVNFNVGAVTGTNYSLVPVGTVNNEFVLRPQRLVHATVSAAGVVSGTSGVNNGPALGAAASGHFGITWSNAFAVAPAVVASVNGGTGVILKITSSTTGALIDVVDSTSGLTPATTAGFYLIAMGN